MAQQFTDAQIKEFKEAFTLFDKDGDGCITATELGNVMRQLGHFPTDEDLSDMIREIDTDGNGSIEFPEFLQLLSSTACSPEDETENLREAFKIFDKDESGTIEKSELREVMLRLGEELTEEQIEDMFNEADTNGDGKIDFEEFKIVMSQMQEGT